jgi:hypothetical protein
MEVGQGPKLGCSAKEKNDFIKGVVLHILYGVLKWTAMYLPF